jgi:hypothetical protein
MIDVGVKVMSKTIVREKLRDYYKEGLSFEERLEVKDALDSLYGVFIEYDAFANVYLYRYSIGYTCEELADTYGQTVEDIRNTLRYCFALLGEVLQLDDEMIVRRVHKPLKETAANILHRIYNEFTEVE